ncbi:MAG: hypothetical protein ACRECZ_06310 [Methylocella sp.]
MGLRKIIVSLALGRLPPQVRYFIHAHCPTIEFGVVGATALILDNHVAITDMGALTEIYRATLDAYFE